MHVYIGILIVNTRNASTYISLPLRASFIDTGSILVEPYYTDYSYADLKIHA